MEKELKNKRLPIGYDLLTDQEKKWLTKFPDTTGWTNKKLKWWLTRQIHLSNHWQTMYYNEAKKK